MHIIQSAILFILIFLILGCHNASHIRTQKILEEDETAISIGVITNLGGDTDAYKFHSIRESNNFGGRAEISYLKGSGNSEFGPYAGFGMTTMDFGIIGGFDYRTYSGLYSNNPLKVGGQIEIILDGGIRRGTHVLKALSLGATACSFGKGFLFALGAGGQKGVEAILQRLHDEIRRDMILLGCKKIKDLNRSNIAFR